jgi:hypothetical protein
MIEIVECTAKRTHKRRCCGCGGEIRVGDVYRRRVMIQEEFAEKSFELDLAHTFCIERPEFWEVTGSIRRSMPKRGDVSCEYVRNSYGLMVHYGSRVLACGKPGTVVGAGNHVYVVLDSAKRKTHSEPYHTSDITPIHQQAAA